MMDMYAYMLSRDVKVNEYVKRHYGEVPRLRGISLMRYEYPQRCDGDDVQARMFARYCGDDVIYIHTRCGACGCDDDDCNYRYFGADKWEDSNADTFLESCDDEFDGTYRDHYFKAVPGDDYDELCRMFDAEHVETEERALDGDTEPENEDSRERLEADVFACLQQAYITYPKVIELLDRQAAITEREVEHDLMKSGRMAVEVERERIKKLTAERELHRNRGLA